MDNMQNILRRIPKIDEVLQDQRLVLFYGTTPRSVIVESVRETIDHLRQEILSGIESLFPRLQDGSVVFKFSRLFFMARKKHHC